jgi:ZIP family zinc transporter
VNNVMLGFAAGVMLAAAFFSLILPGLETARLPCCLPSAMQTGSARLKTLQPGSGLSRTNIPPAGAPISWR